MRKRIFTLCIAILTLTLCFVAAGCTSSRETFEVKKITLSDGGQSAAELVKEICEAHSDRTMGTGADKDFLGFVADKMSAYGYPAADFGDKIGGVAETVPAASQNSDSVVLDEFEFSNYYTGEKEKGYNLVYTVSAAESTEDTVLLIASYDNCANLEIKTTDMFSGQTSSAVVGGEGAYSNATGVAVLLRLAYELAGKELPYNLTIAFVDCGENAWDGAKRVAASYAGNAERFICLNFNRLGGGDYVYVYSDEVSQPYNDYFYSVVAATDDSGAFADVPFNKQTADIKFVDDQKTEYSHFAMYGDNLMFNVYGLAVASYTSFNWGVSEQPFYTEISGKENVTGTSADTYETLIDRLGGDEKGEKILEERLDAVVLNALTAVDAQNAQTLFSAVRSSDPAASGDYADKASNASLIVRITLVIICVGAALGFTAKYRSTLATKQREKIERMRKEAAQGAGQRPISAEDIFGMGGDKKDEKSEENGEGKNGKNDGGSGDDVFEGF